MDTPPSFPQPVHSADESAVRALYDDLLHRWNAREADGFAAHFIEDGAIVGFDGTVVDGQAEIARHLGAIFASHETPIYVQYVKHVRFLSGDTALVQGIAGMPSLMTGTINPTLNSIQSLVAVWRVGVWRIALFQNTPAQLHGRPEAVAQMTEELQRRLDATLAGG